MSKPPTPQVLTANDLLTGTVVFWTGSAWSTDPATACIFADPASQQAALGDAEADAGRVVGAYLADVDEGRLVRLRERIRTTGPTIAYARKGA